jgi:hypothetical protein
MRYSFLFIVTVAAACFSEVPQVLEISAFTRDKAEVSGKVTFTCPAPVPSRDSLETLIGLLLCSLPRDSFFNGVGEFEPLRANRALQGIIKASNDHRYPAGCTLKITTLSLTPDMITALRNSKQAREELHKREKEALDQQQSLEQLEQKELSDFLAMSTDHRNSYLDAIEQTISKTGLRLAALKQQHFPDTTHPEIMAVNKGYRYLVQRAELLRKLMSE